MTINDMKRIRRMLFVPKLVHHWSRITTQSPITGSIGFIPVFESLSSLIATLGNVEYDIVVIHEDDSHE